MTARAKTTPKPDAKPPRHRPRKRLLGRLAMDTGAGSFLSDTRIQLLEAIAEHGSISRAAAAVPLSYKAAWDAVDAMNNLADRPVVERVARGRQGGGTQLTARGRELIALYRAMQQQTQTTLDRLDQQLAAKTPRAAANHTRAVPQRAKTATATAHERTPDAPPDVPQLLALARRLAIRTSARNQFVGQVIRLRKSAVSCELTLALDEHTQIVAGITRESADELGLAIGSQVLALVKASSVLLAVGVVALADPFGEPYAQPLTSARNQLAGTVSRIVAGPVSAEVTLALPAGRSVTASITRDSLQRLGLAEGQRAGALFKASSVILMSLD